MHNPEIGIQLKTVQEKGYVGYVVMHSISANVVAQQKSKWQAEIGFAPTLP